MEVKKVLGRTLLAAAIFGAASMVFADEDLGYISTDPSAAAVAVEPVDAEVPTTPPDAIGNAADDAYFISHQTAQQAWDIIEIGGFLDGGAILNTHGARYNMMSMNSDNQFNANAAYLRVLKKAQTGCGVFDWGFGADTFFGSEAKLYSGYVGLDSDWSVGHRSSKYNNNPLVGELTYEERESYGFALPQLYGEFSANNWKFKIGHFYSLLGYEGVADNRFFYTYGRFIEASPLTHTGAIATYVGLQNTELSLGWVAGEDNTFDRGYSENLITGGVKLNNGGFASLKYAFVAGDGAMAGTGGDLFRNDVVVTANIGRGWEGALLFNYGKFDGDVGMGTWGATATIEDLAQYYGNLEYQTWGGYLYYTINPKWKLGARTEWQRATAETGGVVDRHAPTDPGEEAVEFLEMTLGANWTPTCYDNFVIRPEVRYDKAIIPFDEYAGLFGKGLSDDDQITLAVDVLYKY